MFFRSSFFFGCLLMYVRDGCKEIPGLVCVGSGYACLYFGVCNCMPTCVYLWACEASMCVLCV